MLREPFFDEFRVDLSISFHMPSGEDYFRGLLRKDCENRWVVELFGEVISCQKSIIRQNLLLSCFYVVVCA